MLYLTITLAHRVTYGVSGGRTGLTHCEKTETGEKGNTYCTRPFAHEYPSTDACVLLVVNKNMKMADNIVNTASENLRPPIVNLPVPRVRSTTQPAISEPGTPRTETMA